MSPTKPLRSHPIDSNTEFTQQDRQDIADLLKTVYGDPRTTPRKIGLEARVDDLATDVDHLKTGLFKKIWRYASANALVTTLIGILIGWLLSTLG